MKYLHSVCGLSPFRDAPFGDIECLPLEAEHTEVSQEVFFCFISSAHLVFTFVITVVFFGVCKIVRQSPISFMLCSSSFSFFHFSPHFFTVVGFGIETVSSCLNWS